MELEQYVPSERDHWNWKMIDVTDVADVVALARDQFGQEVDSFFTPTDAIFQKNVLLALVRQNFNPMDEQLIVARDKTTNKLLAYAWCARGEYTTYSPEEIAEVRFAHVDQSLSARDRVTLIAQMIHQWIMWCQLTGVPVLVSSTVRAEQATFLKLHERAGFTVRGSIAYKKIT